MSDPQPPAAPKPIPGLRQCRSLTVRGIQCHSTAVRGHNLCHTHLHYRHPELPQGPKIAIPLFEDHSAIQLVTTQIAHGLLTGQLDPARARALSYNCQVAAMTLPRPHQPRFKPLDAKPVPDEIVADITTAPDGSALGPDLPWLGPGGKFEPTWSISKYFYEKECERLQKKIPASADEYPAEGWLTEQELKEPGEDWRDRTTAHLRRLRILAGEIHRRDIEAELFDLQQKLAALNEQNRIEMSHWQSRPATADPGEDAEAAPDAAPSAMAEADRQPAHGSDIDLQAVAAPSGLPARPPHARACARSSELSTLLSNSITPPGPCKQTHCRQTPPRGKRGSHAPCTLHPASSAGAPSSVNAASPFTRVGPYRTLHPTPCTLSPVPCTLHPVPCTLHPVPCTLCPEPCALHPEPCALHPVP